MDNTELYNTIIVRLNELGYEDVAADLGYVLQGAVTRSQALGSSRKFLFDLKKNNPLAYKLIDDLIIAYLKYCRQNGIIILFWRNLLRRQRLFNSWLADSLEQQPVKKATEFLQLQNCFIDSNR